MRINLNLATRPFADLGPAIKRLRIGMGILALLCILLGFGLRAIHQKAEEARTNAQTLDSKIAAIAVERQQYEDLMRQPDNAQLLQQAAVLNKIIDAKAFSWTLAMEDLETVLPSGVQVTSLEPARQKDGHISVTLRVSGPRDRAVNLVRNLEHSRRFRLPRIVTESSSDTSDRAGGAMRLQPATAGDRVDFDVQAEYNPATADERKATHKPAARRESAPLLPKQSARVGAPVHLAPAVPSRTVYSGPGQPVNPGLNRPIAPAARIPSPAPNDPSIKRPGGTR